MDPREEFIFSFSAFTFQLTTITAWISSTLPMMWYRTAKEGMQSSIVQPSQKSSLMLLSSSSEYTDFFNPSLLDQHKLWWLYVYDIFKSMRQLLVGILVWNVALGNISILYRDASVALSLFLVLKGCITVNWRHYWFWTYQAVRILAFTNLVIIATLMIIYQQSHLINIFWKY